MIKRVAKGFDFIRQVLLLVLLSSSAACSPEAKTYEYTVIVSGGPSGWPIWAEEVTLNGDRRIPGGAISYGYDQTPPTGSRVVLDPAPAPQRVEARWFSHRAQRFFEISLPMPEEFSETVARWFESYPTPDYGHYFIVGFSGKGEAQAWWRASCRDCADGENTGFAVPVVEAAQAQAAQGDPSQYSAQVQYFIDKGVIPAE
jgi:DUF2931 family protein|tara:strand:- start:5612 stop:6214 length:603 start_codon:yes stop_codon:yes gene_type:complete